MKFEEALDKMRNGKTLTEGVHEYRIVQLFQFRMIGESNWLQVDEMYPDEILHDVWEIVEGVE